MSQHTPDQIDIEALKHCGKHARRFMGLSWRHTANLSSYITSIEHEKTTLTARVKSLEALLKESLYITTEYQNTLENSKWTRHRAYEIAEVVTYQEKVQRAVTVEETTDDPTV